MIAPAAVAAQGTLPGGTSIAVNIDSPAGGEEFVLAEGQGSVDVTVEGTASVGEKTVAKDTTVAYVVDRSGSSGSDAGVNCDGTAGTDTILTCEKEAVEAANDVTAEPNSTVDLTGLASFSSSATVHDVDLGVAGQQLLVAPDYDGDGNSTPDVVDVVNTLSAGGGTAFDPALDAAKTILEDPSNTNSTNLVIFLTDGLDGAVDTDLPPNTTVKAFAIGGGSSCTEDLQAVADQSTSSTGGSCEHITDISTLADAIADAISESVTEPTLDSLSLTVDGGDPQAIPNAEIDPDLPQTSPGTVDYSTTTADLGVGEHQLCVTATGSDAQGEGSVQECVTVTVVEPAPEPQVKIIPAGGVDTGGGSGDQGPGNLLLGLGLLGAVAAAAGRPRPLCEVR